MRLADFPDFGTFKCPECGGAWFGTTYALDDEKRRVHCHDQHGQRCRWSGRGEDAGLKYPPLTRPTA